MRIRVKSTILLAALVLAACGDEAVLQAPPRGAPAPVAAPLPVSTITVIAKIPFAALKRAAAAALPASLPVQGEGQVGCAKVAGMKGCADYRWHATITPEGTAAITRAGDAVRLTLPLRIAGEAGVRGDLAKLLSLNAKKIDAQLTPAADIRLDIGRDWCPKAEVTPVGDWAQDVEIEAVGKTCLGDKWGGLFGHHKSCVGPAWIDMTDLANKNQGALRKPLDRAVERATDCAKLKPRLAALWHAWSIPLGAIGGDKVFVNLTPTAAALSNVMVEDDGVKFVAQLSATTAVSTVSTPPAPLALPPLERATAQASILDLNVQATAPYALIKAAAAKAIVGKTYRSKSSAGEVTVRVRDLDLYPSGEALAVGLKVDAHVPGYLFDSTGWVYLTAKPAAAADGTSVDLKDLHYTTALNSGLWQAVVALFDDQIVKELNAHSHVDLNGVIAKASAQVLAGLNGEKVPGLVLKAETPHVAIRNIVVGKDGLVANVSLTMPFSLTLTEALLERR